MTPSQGLGGLCTRLGAGAESGRRSSERSRAAACLAVLLAAVLSGCAGGAGSSLPRPLGGVPSTADGPYHLYVANESSDAVSHVVFEPGSGLRLLREIGVDVMPGDIDGPHGIGVAPEGDRWYVTVAHGTPFGSVWAFRTGDDTFVGRTPLGRFPATIATASGGRLLIVANFNLHGDPVPSDLSLVHAPDLTEIFRIPTCVTPHGGRTNDSGDRHYSVCMRSDQLVELDMHAFEVSRRLSLRPDAEGALPVDDRGSNPSSPSSSMGCAPTWVTPGSGVRSDGFAYVACNGSGRVLEVDLVDWSVTRRFELGSGPYNMALSPDGLRLVVTLKGGQAIAVVDLDSGEIEGRLETSRPITHGVVLDPSGRYAFVTNESIGSTPGTLDVFDLGRMERVDSMELGHQPGGLDLWQPRP